MRAAPDWVIQRKKENTIQVESFIHSALKGNLELRGKTTLQKLKALKFEILGIVTVAKRSNIDKEKWSKYISFYKTLANTDINKKNLSNLEKYITLYSLKIDKPNKLKV